MQISNLVLLVSAASAFALMPLAQAADNEAQAKAREALRAKVGEPQSSVTAPAAQVPPPASLPSAAPAPTHAQPAGPQLVERARAATRERIRQLDSGSVSAATSPAADEVALNKAREAMRARSAQIQPQPTLKPGELPPLERAPSSLGTDKEQKLAELLRKYRADEITPEDYHRERMKILSAP